MTTHLLPPTRPGFSLYELIGVLAFMAILAAVLAPDTARLIESSAWTAEETTLATLEKDVEEYLKSSPEPANRLTSAAWTSQLGTLSASNASQAAANARAVDRLFLPEPGTDPTERFLLLSSLRVGLNLPTAADINAAGFGTIWDTPARTVPASSSWSGWDAWGAVENAGDWLVVERINVRPLYLADVVEEEQRLAAIADALELYVRLNGSPPVDYDSGEAKYWYDFLGSYASLGPDQMRANGQGIARLYLPDPDSSTSPVERALLLSAVRASLALPTSADINTADFEDIWTTARGTLPPVATWAGWANWSGSEEYLLIERIEFASIYQEMASGGSGSGSHTVTCSNVLTNEMGGIKLIPVGAVDGPCFRISQATSEGDTLMIFQDIEEGTVFEFFHNSQCHDSGGAMATHTVSGDAAFTFQGAEVWIQN